MCCCSHNSKDVLTSHAMMVDVPDGVTAIQNVMTVPMKNNVVSSHIQFSESHKLHQLTLIFIITAL